LLIAESTVRPTEVGAQVLLQRLGLRVRGNERSVYQRRAIKLWSIFAHRGEPGAPVSDISSLGEHIEARSSRLWALVTLKFTRLLFPARVIADRLGVSTVTVGFWLTPWIRQDEHLPMSHIAEVSHNRGFLWDSIAVESSGGLNPLMIDGVPKSSARRFVAYLRETMNVAPPITPPPAPPRR
jgi:hypothetical protein